MNRSDAHGAAPFFHDRRGVAAVEFALTFPIMLTLLVGMVEVATTVQSLMRYNLSVHTVADLVSRCRTVNAADLTDDFMAAALIINSTKTLPPDISLVAASVSFDGTSGTASIDWIRGAGASIPSNATVLASAAGKGTKGSSVIVAGIQYSYNLIGSAAPPLNISHFAYAVPRLVQKVPQTGACDWSL